MRLGLGWVGRWIRCRDRYKCRCRCVGEMYVSGVYVSDVYVS